MEEQQVRSTVEDYGRAAANAKRAGFDGVEIHAAWAWLNDWRTRGRVHPTYVIGGIALFVSLPLRRWIGFQDFWHPIAQWLIS